MDADDPVLRGFALRMNEICDEKQLTPGRGRQTELAAQFKVTPKAARKWLLGLGYPEMAMALRICRWSGVNLNWLLQGEGPKQGMRIDTKALVLDEAVRRLPRDQALDVIDGLRSKLNRGARYEPGVLVSRYTTMLDAYEDELSRKTS